MSRTLSSFIAACDCGFNRCLVLQMSILKSTTKLSIVISCYRVAIARGLTIIHSRARWDYRDRFARVRRHWSGNITLKKVKNLPKIIYINFVQNSLVLSLLKWLINRLIKISEKVLLWFWTHRAHNYQGWLQCIWNFECHNSIPYFYQLCLKNNSIFW